MKTIQNGGVFGLSPQENKVFLSLRGDSEASPAWLTKETRLPRTTLLRVLDALVSRGLVHSSKKGKRVVYSRAPQGVLEKDILASAEKLGVSIAGISVPGFNLLRGADALTRAFWDLLESLPREGRLLGIQPTLSGLALVEKMRDKEVIRVNEYIKERGVIVEGVLEEGFLRQMAQEKGREWLESFAGRAASTSIVPDEYLKYLADLYIAGNRAMLANWRDEVGVVIENQEVVALLKSMFRFMHDSGKRYDNNQLAELLLEKKESEATF